MIEEKIQRFYYKKSRIQQFKGFCYTVQLGTMEKAGDKLCLGKAAISLQIKALEDDLGVKLFERSANHRLKPTQAGLNLYEKLIPLVQNVDGILEEFLEKESDNRKNTLNIAGHHVVLSNILPKYLALLKNSEEFKDIKFKLFNIPKSEAYEKTITGEVDIMIYPVENKEKIPMELELNKVLKYQPVFVLYKGHPLADKEARDITVSELSRTNFILIDQFGVSSIMNHLIEDHNIGYDDIMFKNGNWNLLKALVAQGLGICAFSKYFINDFDLEKNNIVVKDASHIVEKINFSFLIKKNTFVKDGIKLIIREFLKDKDL